MGTVAAVLLANADVLTIDERFSRHGAVVIEHGRIAAVGTEAELAARFGHAERVDLGGRTLIPGFVDAHHHMLIASIYGDAVDCHPASAPTLESIQRAIGARAAASDPSHASGPAWIVGLGYDAWRLQPRRHPDRHDLDAACRDRPVLLFHFSFHQGVANSRALELAGIDESTPDPPGGRIERDARGRPTGRLFEAPFSLVESLARKSVLAERGDDVFASLSAYETTLFSLGITRLCDPTVSASMRMIYEAARARGASTMPVVTMPVSERGYLIQPWELVDESPPNAGPEDFRSGPLKLFFDGGEQCAVCLSPRQVIGSVVAAFGMALRGRTLAPFRAARGRPLQRGSDGKLHSGVLFYSDREANEVVGRAVERGHSVAIHAFGNEAVAMALEAIARVRKLHAEVPPPRIEHAAMLDQELVRRAADIGVMIVTQPGFLEPMGELHIPDLPGIVALPLRSLADAGARVASSSDGPIGIDPLLALRAAVTRRATPSRRIHPEEAISPEAWLTMATREGARAAGSLDVTGTIEPGKRADLVVLSHSPLDASSLDRLRVEATLLGGNLVYGELGSVPGQGLRSIVTGGTA